MKESQDGDYGICRFYANSIPSSFVLIQDEQGTWLCQCGSSASSESHSDDNTICYTRSIQIITGDGVIMEANASRRIVALDDDDDPSHVVSQSSSRYYGRMLSPNDSDDSKESMGTIAFLSQPVVPILSLSLQIIAETKEEKKIQQQQAPEDTTSPLLLACIKRQLMGCPVLWSSSTVISTVLTVSDTFQTWKCHVQSVQVMPSSPADRQHMNNRGMMLGMIYPSTRITLHVQQQEEVTPDPIATTQSTTSSQAEQLLRETLQCVQAGQMHVPRYFLWTGPPGVGKTYSVKQVLPWCHLHSFRGLATALASLHAAAQKNNKNNKPTLFFFDECDALASTEEGAATLAYWLDEWSSSSSSIVVVAATNRIDDLPASLRRRFHKEMHFVPPTAVERCTMLHQLLQEWWPNNNTMMSEQDLQQVADLCVGYVAADLAALVRQASLAHILDFGKNEASTDTTRNYLLRAMQQVGASALRDAAMTAPLTTTSWDDIAGEAGGAKKALRQAIEWPRTKRKEYELLGLTPPRGILLHGPPGCAKTSLARAAAGAAGVAFVSLAPADVYASSYVGDAEAIVRRSFDLARSAAPCVLFFDEIDAILGVMSEDRNNDGSAGGLARGHSAEARVLSTFLNEMDGVDGTWKDGVLVLGATNRPWTLDAALLRPGRFDKIIYVPPPDREGRRAILEMQTGRWRNNSSTGSEDPIDIDYLSSENISGNMTGAEIKGACQEAAMNALREYSKKETSAPVVRQKDLLDALSSIKPLLSDPFQMESFRLFEGKRRSLT